MYVKKDLMIYTVEFIQVFQNLRQVPAVYAS